MGAAYQMPSFLLDTHRWLFGDSEAPQIIGTASLVSPSRLAPKPANRAAARSFARPDVVLTCLAAGYKQVSPLGRRPRDMNEYALHPPALLWRVERTRHDTITTW